MPGQGGEGTPCFCLSVKPLSLTSYSTSFSQKLLNPDTCSSPTVFHCHFTPFLPVSLQALCRSCFCRALSLINTTIHKIAFIFYSFFLSLTVFRRPTHCYWLKRTVVCSSSLVSCTGFSLQSFFSWQTTQCGWDVP